MAKQKEIKFQDRHGDLRGRQNGMEFWIRKGEPQTKSGEQRYFVAIYPVSNNPRQISTLSRQDFDLAGAKEFCKKIAAGEIKLEDLQAAYDAEDAAKEQAAIKVMEAWGFTYKTAAFVWVKKNRKNGGNFWGMGAYTRANAEVCLLGVSPGFKAGERIRSHKVHQVIEAPFEGHSKKPDETRRRIVELLGDVPRIELFARQRADGWDAWGNEAPEE